MTPKKSSPPRSLTTTLTSVIFGFSALVLLVTSIVQITLSAESRQAELETRQLLIVQDARQSVANFIQQKIDAMSVAVEFSSPIEAKAEERQSILQGLLSLDPAFREFTLLDAQGEQIGFVSRLSQDLSPQFESLLDDSVVVKTKSNEIYVSQVYLDNITSEPLIILAIPVKTVLGDYTGTLAAEVNLKFIWDLVGQIRVGETGYVYVVDNQGNLIAFQDTALVLQGKNASGVGDLPTFIQNPSAVTTANAVRTYTGINGDTVVGTYLPLGTPQWAVAVEIPWVEAYQDVIALGLRSLVLILVVGSLAALAGLYGARRLSAPLSSLNKIANEISKGNLNEQAIETGPAEVVQLASSFNAMTAQIRDLIGNLEKRVTERTSALDASRLESEKRAKDLLAISEISRIINTEKDLDILLPLITRLVSEKFGFYHAGIFLLDEAKQFANLQAANSEGGQRMLFRGHKLAVGQGIVGTVALEGKPRIALDVGADAVFFNNPDLPATRSEMSLPLKSREQVIGVLDVQSQARGEFTDEDLNVLGILADQISVAIENARLFARTDLALNEIQGLYNQYLQKEWKNLRLRPGYVGYRQTSTGGAALKSPLEFPEVKASEATGKLIVSEPANPEDEPSVLAPINLRGQVIGVLNIKSPARNRKWTQEEISLIQSVTDRLAVALENARLFEETNRRAERERLVSEITGKIRSVNDPQTMIQMAAEELRNVLGANRVQVMPNKPDDSGGKNS